MINEKFYIIDHGWAKKYYWFKTIHRSNRNEDYIKLLKSKKIVLGVDHGTTSADMHGSSMTITYFSQKLVDLLKENKIKFNYYSVKFYDKENKSIIFYYIEPHTYPVNIIEEEKILNYIDSFSNSKNNLLQRTNATGEIEFFDFSKWDETDLFGVKDTFYIIITQKLKNILESAKLKNITFTNLEEWRKRGKE